MPSGRRRALLLTLAVLVAALPVGALGTGIAVRHLAASPSPTTAWFTPTRIEVPDDGDLAVSPPSRLRIAALGVDTPLEQLALTPAGVLASPGDYDNAGWYADGPAPGDTGPAVIAGHVDSRTGEAVFYRLHEMRPGGRIEIERAGVWSTFVVVDVGRYAKAEFPSRRVYGPTPGPELRLITCGGEFDPGRHSYRDNVVVYAVLAA